jgi:hypothetical protein
LDVHIPEYAFLGNENGRTPIERFNVSPASTEQNVVPKPPGFQQWQEEMVMRDWGDFHASKATREMNLNLNYTGLSQPHWDAHPPSQATVNRAPVYATVNEFVSTGSVDVCMTQTWVKSPPSPPLGWSAENNSDFIDITYFTNYPYNHSYKCPMPFCCFLGGHHQGDIERVIVRLDTGDYSVRSVYFGAHSQVQGAWEPATKGGGITWEPVTTTQPHTHRPQVFVSSGSHANYARGGAHVRILGFANDLCAANTEDAIRWDPGYLIDMDSLHFGHWLHAYKGAYGNDGVSPLGVKFNEQETPPPPDIRANACYLTCFPLFELVGKCLGSAYSATCCQRVTRCF